MDHIKTCWAVSDGKIGIDNQCLGLGEALGLSPVVKHIALRSPWKQLFPMIPLPLEKAFDPALTGPWPDLLITGGRTGAAVALFVKKASGGKTVTVQIQNPHLDASKFDLMIVGEHDRRAGDNTLVLKGALNRVNPAKLAQAQQQFPGLTALQQPRIAVLIGGNNRCYRFEQDDAVQLAAYLTALSEKGYSIMVTASRRTGEENSRILQKALMRENCYFWDGTGENPYFALLGLADTILVTADSISMISEAASTGKPVYVVPLKGGDRKFNAFHKSMMENGITRPFAGEIEHWSYAPLNDTVKAAAMVETLFQNT